MNMSDEMLRRLADAELLPVETDAPPDGELESSGVPYDVGLQQDLIEYGPDALQRYGMIIVRDCGKETARYNSALWYALGHDLVYTYDGVTVTITDPTAKS